MKYNSIRYEDENFRIRVSADSESYIDKVDDFSKVFHEDIEIKCFVEGSSTLHIGTQSVVTEPGDVVFINPYEFHSTVNYAEEKGIPTDSLVGIDTEAEGFDKENAKALLSRRSVSIAEVSYAVGFDDQFYFSRIFKRITGISPKDYRLSLQWSGEKHSLK